MRSCTTGAIALWPTGNHQGGYYFLGLTTGHHLIRNHWMELPLPQDVIDHVNTLRHCSHATHDLTFAWHDCSPIVDLDSPDDDPYDSDYEPLDSDTTSDDDDDLSYVSNGDITTAGVDYNANNNVNDNNDDNVNDNNDDNDNDDNDKHSDNNDNDDDHSDDEFEEEEDNHEKQGNNDHEAQADEPEEPQNQVNHDENQEELHDNPGRMTGVDAPNLQEWSMPKLQEWMDPSKTTEVGANMHTDSDDEEDLIAEMDQK